MSVSFPKAAEAAVEDNRGRWLPAIVLLGLLAGCATLRGVGLPELDDWESRRETLADLSEWEFRGRIGVSAGDEGFNGKLRWWQHEDLFVASVSGPLGVGTVRFRGDRHQVVVTEEGGEVTELRDAEAELRRRYGWTIPVSSLRYWALGIPDPALPASTRVGAEGRLQWLEQGGWVVNFDEYREGGGQSMPRRMSAINGDTRVRLVIDDWTFY